MLVRSQVVIGDLGGVEIADSRIRLQKKLRLGDDSIHMCTPNYRPPDVWLGSQHFQEDMDMWSFGCVAAEIYARQVFIAPAISRQESPVRYVETIAAFVPPLRSCPASWLEGLPFFKKWYGVSGKAWLRAYAETARPWPPRCLEGCPEGLGQLIQKCLVWHPSDRMTATEAKTNSFLQPPDQLPLHVLLAAQRGKNGVGTIAQADLEPDLLSYLQTCPSWNSLAEEHLRTRAPVSRCLKAEEAALRLKAEIPGFVDEENPRSAAA